MTFCEFYLSKGSIEQLAIKESLFDKSSQCEKNQRNATVIRLENPTPILRLADFQHFTFCQEKGQRYGLVLTDGDNELTATIDQSLYYLVEDLDRNDCRFLRKGSVILLKQYKNIPLSDLLTEKEFDLEQNKDKPILCITDLLLLGHCEETSLDYDINNNIPSDNIITNDDAQTDIRQEIHHDKVTNLITELETSLSKNEWSIACKILAKTLVRQYENSKTGQIGKVQRFLLEDNSGLIELVAFNQFCEKDPIISIDIDKYYIIKNGDIRKSNSNLKAWSDKKSVDFEIQMSFNCDILRCNEFLLDKKHNIKNVLSNESIKETNNFTLKNTSSDINQQQHQQQQQQQQHFSNDNGPKLHEKFTKLNQLIYIKPNSFVDVIGIVCEIGKVKKMNESSKLSLRNIKLIDEANIPISVALWGKQAEDFSFPIGTCLLINKIKVTTFGGVSLSVMRITTLLEIKSNYQIPIANSIFEWWLDPQRNTTNKENVSLSDKRLKDDIDYNTIDEKNKKQRQN